MQQYLINRIKELKYSIKHFQHPAIKQQIMYAIDELKIALTFLKENQDGN